MQDASSLQQMKKKKSLTPAQSCVAEVAERVESSAAVVVVAVASPSLHVDLLHRQMAAVEVGQVALCQTTTTTTLASASLSSSVQRQRQHLPYSELQASRSWQPCLCSCPAWRQYLHSPAGDRSDTSDSSSSTARCTLDSSCGRREV